MPNKHRAKPRALGFVGLRKLNILPADVSISKSQPVTVTISMNRIARIDKGQARARINTMRQSSRGMRTANAALTTTMPTKYAVMNSIVCSSLFQCKCIIQQVLPFVNQFARFSVEPKAFDVYVLTHLVPCGILTTPARTLSTVAHCLTIRVGCYVRFTVGLSFAERFVDAYNKEEAYEHDRNGSNGA